MATYARAAASAVLTGLRGSASKTNGAQVFHQQTRKMAGHGDGPWHRAYDGKPPPAALQGPDYITYAGLTLPKAKKDVDYWYSKVLGSLVWFTMAYHWSLNWEEHWYGDIGYFERDVQKNGWDEPEGHGHH
eukprot:gene17816-24197_t